RKPRSPVTPADLNTFRQAFSLTATDGLGFRLKPIGGQHLVDEVKVVLPGKPAKQIVVQPGRFQTLFEWPAGAPDFRRPEDGRLGNHVPLPDFEDSTVAV